MARSKFESSVAWVYASFGDQSDCPDGADLCSLIAGADAMNHAIPTLTEIVNACEILFRNGLVEFPEGRFRLTTHGQRVSADGFGRRGGLFSTIDNMRKALNKFDHPTVELTPDLSFLTQSAFDAAYEQYRTW